MMTMIVVLSSDDGPCLGQCTMVDGPLRANYCPVVFLDWGFYLKIYGK